MKLITLATASLIFSIGMASASEITSFPIGTTWPDSDGIHINCHGGCIVPYQGYFYWFGESRTGGHSDGISVYRSSDLYNWDNLGFAVTHGGERDDENLQDISEGRLLERPKVIYNASTDKWVMWAHWENGSDYGQARVAILQADKITGPYNFVSTLRPNGHDSRDQTLFLDSDGKAYHFCSTNMNTDINVVRLSDDFLTPSADETLIMKGDRLEATTVCKVEDTYFATFSECNGWDPAPGHTATVIADPLSDWSEGLNFCIDADANRSYRSQGAFVFSVESLGYDPKCFVFYGDRWNSSNVGGSTYVWLPLSVRSGYPTVRNYSTWNLDEVMANMYRYKRAAKISNGCEYSLLERRSDRLVSRLGQRVGFCIKDDNDRVNIRFTFIATADPYVWQLKDSETGLFLTDTNGKLRMQENGDIASALWRFVLLSDGYYNVINESTESCLTVTSNSRTDGSELRLGALGENDAQGFAPYFDSKRHPDYQEAAMYTAQYFKDVADEIKKQNYQPGENAGIQSLPFEADKEFAVMHTISARALTLGLSGTTRRGTVNDFEQLPEQCITFVKAPGDVDGYNIKGGNGYYLHKDGNYNTSWSDTISLSSSEAIFTVESVGKQYVIKCASNGKYLGTDGTDDGDAIYSDKSGEGRNLSYWYLADFNNSPIVTDQDLFTEVLDNVDLIFGSIDPSWCGTAPFDYSIEAYDALGAALDKAFDVTDNFETAKLELEVALAEFETNKTVLPDANWNYTITHESGLDLCYQVGFTSPILGESGDGDENKYWFLPLENGTYAIYNAYSGQHLSNVTSNRWSMCWAESTDSKRANWTVEISTHGKKAIRNEYVKGYIGCDSTEPGSLLYCDKNRDALNSQWTISPAANSNEKISKVAADATIRPVESGVAIVTSSKAFITIYSIAGTVVTTAEVNGSTIINLPKGIYITAVRTSESNKRSIIKV